MVGTPPTFLQRPAPEVGATAGDWTLQVLTLQVLTLQVLTLQVLTGQLLSSQVLTGHTPPVTLTRATPWVLCRQF